MKKLFLSLLVVCFTFSAYTQEQGKIRVGLNSTYEFPKSGFGVGGDLDIRYNISDNFNIGGRFGLTAMAKESNKTNNSFISTGMTYALVHGDYYINNGSSIFAPFIGGGLGMFNVANVQTIGSSSIKMNTTDVDRLFGGVVRVGFELWKLRLGLEYFLIPESDLRDVDQIKVGTAKNSYFNLSLGFYIGGGKWRK